jgi:hypothetical protein
MKRNKKIIIKLSGRQDKISLYLKIPKEMEDYFKNLSASKTEKSNYWFIRKKELISDQAEFYCISDQYSGVEKTFYQSAFNSYGCGLIDNSGRINLAPLRTCGASKGVYLTSERFGNISNIDFEYYIRKLGENAKEIWKNFITPKEIKAVISFEI